MCNRVFDASGGTAIRNALIDLQGHGSTLTAEGGYFRFEDVRSGAYTLRVDAFGFAVDSLALAVAADTTLVISHWQYAGTGLLPELEHLADLLAATRQTRPEQPTRTRLSKRSSDRAGHSTGHPVGHPTDRLTSAVRPGGVA